MSKTLFISDLHLDGCRPGVLAFFLAFLADCAGQANALYILGDLFETWIGDDDDDPDHQDIREGLQHLTDSGTLVWIMRGNRDFLLGERFAAETGCRLLPEPSVIDLYGQRTLLMHGDTLCTEDLPYQMLRQQLRDPTWQQGFLSKPLEERRQLAQALRLRSQAAMQHKSPLMMDAQPAAIVAALREHSATQLIHGHTHRPGIDEWPVQDRMARRIVLGDWYEQGSVLICEPSGCELSTLPLV